MPPAKHAPKKASRAKAATLPLTVSLRKSPQPKRVSPAVIDLGVLNEHLGYFVRRFQISIFQDFIRRLSRIDISPAQFSVLVIIGANEGLSQSELGATLGIERARLVRMLHLLDRRGLTEAIAEVIAEAPAAVVDATPPVVESAPVVEAPAVIAAVADEPAPAIASTDVAPAAPAVTADVTPVNPSEKPAQGL